MIFLIPSPFLVVTFPSSSGKNHLCWVLDASNNFLVIIKQMNTHKNYLNNFISKALQFWKTNSEVSPSFFATTFFLTVYSQWSPQNWSNELKTITILYNILYIQEYIFFLVVKNPIHQKNIFNNNKLGIKHIFSFYIPMQFYLQSTAIQNEHNETEKGG